MTSDYRVSPQRSSSIIVSRLLRDLFAPHRPPRQCVLVSLQYASSAPICFQHHSRCTTPSTTTFPPLFSFYIFSTAPAPLQRWRGMLDCIPLCSPNYVHTPGCIHTTAFILYKHFSQPLAIMASGVQQRSTYRGVPGGRGGRGAAKSSAESH